MEESDAQRMMEIVPYVSFGNIRLGESEDEVVANLSAPSRRRMNRLDDIELDYKHMVVRLRDGSGVVEITARPEFVQLGNDRISRHDLPEYLRQADLSARESLGFVVSPKFGIAVDTDTANDGWISVFEHGRWDDAE